MTNDMLYLACAGAAGSAAHRLVKLARDLSRQGSQLPSQLPSQLASYVTSLATTPAASQPGSPTTAAAGAAASAPAAQQGPGRGSRSWGPSRQASAAGSPAGSQPGSPAAAGAGAQEGQAGARGFSRAPSRLSRASSAPLAAPAAPSGRPAGPSRLSSTVVAPAPGPGSEASAAAAAPPALPPIAVPPPAQQAPRLVALAPPPVSTPQQSDTAVAGGGMAPANSDDGGISDLQELLDLHRAYIRGVSSDCLVFGGNPAVREGVDAALQDVMDFALRLQAAVRVGSAGRSQAAWVQVREGAVGEELGLAVGLGGVAEAAMLVKVCMSQGAKWKAQACRDLSPLSFMHRMRPCFVPGKLGISNLCHLNAAAPPLRLLLFTPLARVAAQLLHKCAQKPSTLNPVSNLAVPPPPRLADPAQGHCVGAAPREHVCVPCPRGGSHSAAGGMWQQGCAGRAGPAAQL